MPFKSQAQRGFMYANHPELAAEFEAATPKGAKLPRHVAKRKRTAPLPAANVGAASVPAPDTKWLQKATGAVASLNRLRSTVRKTSGPGTAPY